MIEEMETSRPPAGRRPKSSRDLTTGPIGGHLLQMAAFIALGLIVQTLQFLVDLYFVGHLGEAAVAGVSSAGTATFVAMAATQLVAIGSLSLISQAVGRKDDADAQRVFEGALSLSLVIGAATLLLGYTAGMAGVRALAADAPTAAAGQAYLAAFLPSLALMFPVTAMASALRASGVVGAPMLIQLLTVLLNAILAPLLITGWGTGHPLGVAGAGLASSVATLLGATALAALFGRMQGHLRLSAPLMLGRLDIWRRVTAVGLPAAGEFLMLFVISGSMYWIIRGFGAHAQAGFGIASRVMQSIFLPAMAVAFAAAPIAGQNFGAGLPDRVRATFRHSAVAGSLIMLALTLLCQIKPEALLQPFSTDADVIAVGAQYLRITSWNFVAIGLVFACSGMFQAFGDTRPSLFSSSARMLTFVLPALWLARQPGVELRHLWYLSVASVSIQALTSLALLHRQMRMKLQPATPPVSLAV
ncbi:MAG TPA: MATE family efflux transporter [Allosphingosinicella sp.]|jgi:putative MATE family efflux protein